MTVQELVDLIADSKIKEGFFPVCGDGLVYSEYFKGGLKYWECLCIECAEVFYISEPILPDSSRPWLRKRFLSS